MKQKKHAGPRFTMWKDRALRGLSPDQLLRFHTVIDLLHKGHRPYQVNQFWRELVEKKSQFIPKVWGDIP